MVLTVGASGGLLVPLGVLRTALEAGHFVVALVVAAGVVGVGDESGLVKGASICWMEERLRSERMHATRL